MKYLYYPDRGGGFVQLSDSRLVFVNVDPLATLTITT